MPMSLFRKVRTLMGALVHKPFMPRPEKVDRSEKPASSPEGVAHRDAPTLKRQQPGVLEEDRVAELIARQQQHEGG